MLSSLVVIALIGGVGLYILGSLGVAERWVRSLAIALNAALNAAWWWWLWPGRGLFLGVPIGAIGLLSAIPSIAKRSGYQRVLGWASWLMPMSWPASALGLLLFALTLLASPGLRGFRVRLDPSSGTVEVSGLPRLGFRGGFNLGNFTFLLGTPLTPFHVVGISSHETGHTLNVAAFGSVWHLIGNGIDQNVRPFARGARAYGELLAESRRPERGQPVLQHWS